MGAAGPRCDRGQEAAVSSADIYEINGEGLVTTITSYAVELDA